MNKTIKAYLELVALLLAGLCFLCVVIGAFVLVVRLAGEFKCSSRWAGAYQYRYETFSGCKVNVNGKWFPEDRVRATE